MDTPAELITLETRDAKLFPKAFPAVEAVLPAARRPVVPGRYYLVVEHDYCTVFPPPACGSLQNGLRDIEIVVIFVLALLHSEMPPVTI
jgi:hypothetical protein